MILLLGLVICIIVCYYSAVNILLSNTLYAKLITHTTDGILIVNNAKNHTSFANSVWQSI